MRNIIGAWRHAASLGDGPLMTQLLSLAKGALTQRDQREKFSVIQPISKGDSVLVLQNKSWRRGVCTGVTVTGDGPSNIDVAPSGVFVERSCSRRMCELECNIPSTLARVQHSESLVCTEYQTKTASHHEATHYAGAIVTRSVREGWTRIANEHGTMHHGRPS